MQYNSAFRTAAQLTAQARAASQALLDSFQLPAFFPSKSNLTLSYEFNVNQLNLARTATFRSYDATSSFGSVPAQSKRSGTLPPISEKLRVSEIDQLRMMGQNDAIGQKLEDYATMVGASIAARVALAQGQAADSGQVVINENGLVAEIDFGRAAGNTVTAATPWSTDTANALGDITSYRNYLIGLNQEAPGVAMFGTSVLAALQSNQSIIKAATGRGTDINTIISADDVISVLSSYFKLRTVINDDKVSVDGTTTPILPNDHFLLLPDIGAQIGNLGDGAIGSTQWGVPAEVLNTTYGVALAEGAGIFAGGFHGTDPEGEYVLGSAIVLPTSSAANKTFSADVL